MFFFKEGEKFHLNLLTDGFLLHILSRTIPAATAFLINENKNLQRMTIYNKVHRQNWNT